MRFPKPSRTDRLADEEAAARAHDEETARIRKACILRERERCALCALRGHYCYTPRGALEMDHFWGRGKEEQTVENCWMLCPFHHALKTRNQPSRSFWLDAFRAHAALHGYTAQVRKVDRTIRKDVGR